MDIHQMSRFLVEITTMPAEAGDRDTIGGWPILEPDQPRPTCQRGIRTALFLQLDIPPDVPVFGGDHLLACPARCDPAAAWPVNQ
jgi:hypothetical protein